MNKKNAQGGKTIAECSSGRQKGGRCRLLTVVQKLIRCILMRVLNFDNQQLNGEWPFNGGSTVMCIIILHVYPNEIKVNFFMSLFNRSKLLGKCDLCCFVSPVKEKLAHDPDSEVATTSLRVSLLCPVSNNTFTICLLTGYGLYNNGLLYRQCKEN